MQSTDTPEKRKWIYIESPRRLGIAGCACGNADPEWSEYCHRLWCSRCQIDFTPEHWGVLDGPVGIGVSEFFGIYFDTIDLSTGEVSPGPNGVVHFKKGQ